MTNVFYKKLEFPICDVFILWSDNISHPVISIKLKKHNEKINDLNLCDELKFFKKTRIDVSRNEPSDKRVLSLIDQLNQYFFENKPIENIFHILNLNVLTNFQRKVLQTLSKVAFGNIVSYKDLAIESGFPKAFRAVGTVMNKNHFPIVIPCHRVIKSDNSIGDFALGSEIKRKLLVHEGIVLD